MIFDRVVCINWWDLENTGACTEQWEICQLKMEDLLGGVHKLKICSPLFVRNYAALHLNKIQAFQFSTTFFTM
jgi:hypothetical protein